MEIGDTVSGAGVRPDGSNFSDTELAYFLTQEGDSVGRAAARACETLARLWASQVDLRVGPRDEKLSQAAESWAKQALELRAQYGGGAGVLQAGTIDQALLRESAARVVRKEIVALTKAARRAGDDFAAWEREVREFYADHAEFCAQTLQMPRAVAQEYVASQIASALELGVPALTVDEAQTARMLAEWAADAGKAVG